MGCIEAILLMNLMVINFNYFFVFGSNIFETTIELVGKILCKVWNQKNNGAKSQFKFAELR